MTAEEPTPESLRTRVRERYGAIATDGCCGSADSSTPSCCSTNETCSTPETLGYSAAELATLPDGADLGLGCGHPTGLAGLHPGEVVVDLGSGAGIDCFLAADRVGPEGRVIGVDMTPEMIARARSLAERSGRRNVEFRLGEIEHLPIADASADVVLSNCVINLAPEKGPVYREAFRVLRPGGRLSIADVIATRPVPAELRRDPAQWTSCSSGALSREEIVALLEATGFTDIEVDSSAPAEVADSLRAQREIGVVPGTIRASRPGPP